MNVSVLERIATLVKSNSYIQFRRGLHMAQEVVTDTSRPFAELRAAVRENGFTDVNHVSNSDGSYFQLMPLCYDKTRILKHAISIAKQSGSNRAMTLGAAVGIAHPYSDGNGRTARFIHSVNAGQSLQDIIDSGIITPHDNLESNNVSRQRIDLTPPGAVEPYLQEIIYDKTGIEDHSFRPHFPSEDWGNIPSQYTSYAKLAKKCYDSNSSDRGLSFALNALHAKGFAIPYEEAPTAPDSHQIVRVVNMDDLASQLSKKELKMLLTKAQDYRRHRAEAWVDCVSPNTAAGARHITIDRQTMSAAEHSLQLTINICYP